MKKTILINLFGGPGISKSTTATGVFSILKMHDIDCEYVPEFAKDLVWEDRLKSLKNQIYIFSKQYHRLWRLNGVVDIIITDSPLLFTLVYDNDSKADSFKNMVKEVHSSFDNLNFLLTRCKKYNPNGRYQTEDEAKEVDKKIVGMLDQNGIMYNKVTGTHNAVNIISKHILDILKIEQRFRIEKV